MAPPAPPFWCALQHDNVVSAIFQWEHCFWYCYAALSVLANSVHYGFFCLHLLHFIHQSPTARDVLSAILVPWRQLGLTLLVTLVILWCFALVIFANVNDMFDSKDYEFFECKVRHEALATLLPCHRSCVRRGAVCAVCTSLTRRICGGASWW